MGIKGNVVPARAETTVVALVRDEDRFEAVIAPARQEAHGTHELRYLWNRRPFISGLPAEYLGLTAGFGEGAAR
jgi:hypothetical protein